MTDPNTVAKNVILKMGVRELSGILRVSQRMAHNRITSFREAAWDHPRRAKAAIVLAVTESAT